VEESVGKRRSEKENGWEGARERDVVSGVVYVFCLFGMCVCVNRAVFGRERRGAQRERRRMDGRALEGEI